MKKSLLYILLSLALLCVVGFQIIKHSDFGSCLVYYTGGFREVARERADRFLGKVQTDTARCRGGEAAVRWGSKPWLDWPRYWATAGAESKADGLVGALGFLSPDRRGIDGALLDLEYQRIELLKFNLFDNSGTFEKYTRDQADGTGKTTKVWPQLRLPKNHLLYKMIGGDGPQRCRGELIRFRTLTGICNDILNPLMGATDQPFARNASFEAAFPDLELNDLARNRHGGRIGLLTPDPQVISRELFTRRQTAPERCRDGHGLPNFSVDAHCDYQKAAHVNVLAAFWIQFMTHDWFSHLDEGHNDAAMIATGCGAEKQKTGRSLTAEEIKRLGCRPEDRIDRSLIAEHPPSPTFSVGNKSYLSRAPKTTLNKVTAWWDASQIYGYSEASRRRVKRDPGDPAKLLLDPSDSHSEAGGYLPLLKPSDPQNPQWAGQEAVAFPDNWNIGLSFFHNVFAREHNLFVDEFRHRTTLEPERDSGLRNPDLPDQVIRYKDVNADELFEIARLVVSAEIAKIHTIEWTPQMLYNEPLYLAMNANWSGLLQKYPRVSSALETTLKRFADSERGKRSTEWYSAFAAGPGIFALGSKGADISGGVNHFGSPFNFPEEFINVYRLHSMVPDLIELRAIDRDPNVVRFKIPVADTVLGKATQAMRRYGIADWALSMGRLRAGRLILQNHPLFLQNLELPRLKRASGKIDVLALDILRDRERGIPRYNEFRRQYGLRQLTGFDDFVNPALPRQSLERIEQQQRVALLREIYGRHKCDAKKIITDAQKNPDGSPINDCLSHPDGTWVDNIEDLDALVGWLAEPVRPHGFAISETQLQVFILNASRRLFSDRFLTSSFRPEFYSEMGVRWVNDNGPDGEVMERRRSNGHEIAVSPLKRVLLRTIPELKTELDPVINVFDPWARDRGDYYSLQWKPRPGAESDPAFK
ncbi:MAG: peroxidase family protein [Chloroflexota bacterium]